MMDIPLWIIPAIPLVLVLAYCVPALRGYVRRLVPFAPLPALLVALAEPGLAPQRIDWLLLGTDLALTDIARPFLIFTALLWGLAGWQLARLIASDADQNRTTVCFLLAMSGNLGLLIAQDMAAFYTLFAMMSLASWGLVLHGGSVAQVFAGRIYIAFAIVGEIALFAGLAMGSFATDSLALSAMADDAVPTLATVLVAIGFLIKLGAVPLHLWLPTAHAAAPAPASAVLSGAMLKAGLFGLIAVLPLGQTALPEIATAFAGMALVGLLIAPLLGVVQGDPKAVMAYSSVGQMSLILLGLAAALAAPAAWSVIAPALVMLATHHAFSKAALFLGVPVVWSTERGTSRIGVLALLALPALALAGLPWTSGFWAKDALKAGLDNAPAGWVIWIGAALFLASFGTALLMLRAGYLLWGTKPKPDVTGDVALPWLAMIALVLFGLGIAGVAPETVGDSEATDLWPLVGAAGLAVMVAVIFRRANLRLEAAAPGELLGMVRHEAVPAPVDAKKSGRGGSPLVMPRRETAILRPEHGALAILGIAVALGFFMALTPAPAPEPPASPPDLVNAQ